MKKFSSILITIIFAIILHGCSTKSKDDKEPFSIRELTGMTAPAETSAEQNARAREIISRSDSMIISTIYGETSDVEFPTVIMGSRCAGTQCVISEPRSGHSSIVNLSDLEFVEGSPVVLGTKNGITLMSETRRDASSESTSFGAWMEHSSFVAETGRLVFPDDNWINMKLGITGGDLTGSHPTGSATWIGLMVGTPVTGENSGDRLVGDAALNYDMEAGGGIDVAFSSIKNIDLGKAHTTSTVIFGDVPIKLNGTFETGFVGNRIQGAFYGPGHVETSGVFEQSNIVGAFGAKQ